jgi:RNA polymerase sigma factor (sigma-70 family)
MNVHVTFKVQKTPDIEKEVNNQIEKIRKRLQVFRPELVHLKASIDQPSAREGTLVALNLRLPSGQLAVESRASSATAALKTAFDDLMQQITRHKELLRSSHKWERWRGTPRDKREHGVPFEATVAAVKAPSISADDVRSYINAGTSRLERFVARELAFRQAEQDLPEDMVTTMDVIDEVVARALDDRERPEKLALEAWLYRLAMEALEEICAARASEKESDIHLEDSRRPQNVRGSDEPVLQFHQPDEGWTRESSIPDRRVATPEQVAYSGEIMALIQSALRGANRTDREAFLLYGMEGFSLPEIAAITGRHEEAVRDSIQRARDCLRVQPEVASHFQQKPAVRTRA